MPRPDKWLLNQASKIINFFISYVKSLKGDVATNLKVDAFYMLLYLLFAVVFLLATAALNFNYKPQITYGALIIAAWQVCIKTVRDCQQFIHDKLRSSL